MENQDGEEAPSGAQEEVDQQEQTTILDLEVVQQKFGHWFIPYYQMCREEIEAVRAEYPHRWRYLPRLYGELIENERKLHEGLKKDYNGDRSCKEIKNFLQREHIRTHRGGYHPVNDAHPPGLHLSVNWGSRSRIAP